MFYIREPYLCECKVGNRVLFRVWSDVPQSALKACALMLKFVREDNERNRRIFWMPERREVPWIKN